MAKPWCLHLCHKLGGRGQQQWFLLASQLHCPLPPSNPVLQPAGDRGHCSKVSLSLPQQSLPQHRGMGRISLAMTSLLRTRCPSRTCMS